MHNKKVSGSRTPSDSPITLSGWLRASSQRRRMLCPTAVWVFNVQSRVDFSISQEFHSRTNSQQHLEMESVIDLVQLKADSQRLILNSHGSEQWKNARNPGRVRISLLLSRSDWSVRVVALH